jgi:glycosyltransferase involved in cell wall biosynthesis
LLKNAGSLSKFKTQRDPYLHHFGRLAIPQPSGIKKPKMPSNSRIKVSVAIITYNHEQFIAKALDGILMQKVDFHYEVIIGEDCSTDNTRRIILDYHERNPGKFRLLLHETNLGPHGNAARVHQACTGQYVAQLEGDDYWTSPHKLQKQVDFLDSHPECAICFHNAMILYKDGRRDSRNYCRDDQKEFSTVEDLLLSDFIPTCSIMLRRGLLNDVPGWVSSVINGDWAFLILNAQHGKIGYINEVMAAFMSHPGGIWSRLTKDEVDRRIIEFYEALHLNAPLGLDHKKMVRRLLLNRYVELCRKYEDVGDLFNARTYAKRCVTKHLFINKQLVKVLLHSHVPRLYELLMGIKRAVY